MKNTAKLSLLFLLSFLINKGSICTQDEVAGIEDKVARLALSESPVDSGLQTSALSHDEAFIESVINKGYDRDLVTRFIKACPSQEILSQSVGISSGTISKLKNHEVYGKLEPSARRLWDWLQSKGVANLRTELGLTDKNVKSMANSLRLLDLSKLAIVYDELGTDLRSSGNLGNSSPRLASEVANYLHRMKGTFTSINLAENLLSDDGFRVIAKELQTHDLLEEINIRSNKIGDIGLKFLIPMLGSEHLKKINIAKNIGPGELTLQQLRDAIPLKNRENVKIIIN